LTGSQDFSNILLDISPSKPKDAKLKSRYQNSLPKTVSQQISEWMQTAFAQFLSSESRILIGIKDLGEFKAHAIDRFKGILHMAVKTSLKTNSPIPEWAAAKVIEAWNVPDF